MPTDSSIPPVRQTALAKARAARKLDPSDPSSAAQDHAAAQINAAIDHALSASGEPLKRAHAEALAARLKAASR